MYKLHHVPFANGMCIKFYTSFSERVTETTTEKEMERENKKLERTPDKMETTLGVKRE